MTDNVSLAQALIGKLSLQELEVLRGLLAGYSHAAIAQHVGVAESQSAALKQSLMKKLGAAVTADAVRIGIYAGL